VIHRSKGTQNRQVHYAQRGMHSQETLATRVSKRDGCVEEGRRGRRAMEEGELTLSQEDQGETATWPNGRWEERKGGKGREEGREESRREWKGRRKE